jgi:hypothetical protein
MGNLIADAEAEISHIHWNNSGKVTKVDKSGSSNPDIAFYYDATGNRYKKEVREVEPAAVAQENNMRSGSVYVYEGAITYNVRDASGNVLATYTYNSGQGDKQKVDYHIYGSDRLGVASSEKNMFDENQMDYNLTFVMMGERTYELKNHLGNVLSTVSDRKTFEGTNFSLDILAAPDYSPFYSHVLCVD